MLEAMLEIGHTYRRPREEHLISDAVIGWGLFIFSMVMTPKIGKRNHLVS